MTKHEKNIKKLNGFILFVTVLLASNWSHSQTISLNSTTPEIVVSYTEVRNKTFGDDIDASLSMYTANNSIYWIFANVDWHLEPDGVNSNFDVWHSVTRGPLTQPAQTLESSTPQWDLHS